MNPLSFELGAAAALAGIALGFVYFAALRHSVTRLENQGGWRLIVLFSLLRIGCAIAAFALLAKLGAVPLILAAGGFLLARMIAVRRVQKAG
ncbi:MAG: ATP synthase subunit I [Alphaproteobacteria bacterium]